MFTPYQRTTADLERQRRRENEALLWEIQFQCARHTTWLLSYAAQLPVLITLAYWRT